MSKFDKPFFELRCYLPLTADKDALRALNTVFGDSEVFQQFLQRLIQEQRTTGGLKSNASK